MHTIKHIFTRYTALLWALLKPLGVWGIVLIAALDGGFIGLPMDAVVAGYVYKDGLHFYKYVLLASLGSALGSIVVYVVGYEGGEELLRKRISAERFEKMHAAFNKHPFWSLMFPAMLPPPTPFKLFELAAAVSKMSFSRFLLAVFCGRMIRFLLLSLLTLKFGPGAVHVFAAIFRKHYYVVLTVAVAALVAWLMRRSANQSRKRTTEILNRKERQESH